MDLLQVVVALGFEVIRTPIVLTAYLAASRREIKRCQDVDVPVNPYRIVRFVAKRDGAAALFRGFPALFIFRVASWVNAQIVSTIVGKAIRIPQVQAIADSFIGSIALTTCIDLMLVPSLCPATLIQVKSMCTMRSEADVTAGCDTRPTLLQPLQRLPVQKWFAGAWLFPLTDIVRQLTMRILFSSVSRVVENIAISSNMQVVLVMGTFIATHAVIYPIQIVQHRFSLALGTKCEYRSIVDAARTIKREEGMGAFYDGFTLSALGLVISQMF